MLLIWTFSPNCIMLPCCICRFSACSSLLGQCISIKKNPTSNENQFYGVMVTPKIVTVLLSGVF